MTKPVLIVAGPTASGKSILAIAIAEAFDGVVINADSMQVYRELAILTARPGEEALTRAPHRLYGVLSVRDPCSAGRWRQMALNEIARAHAGGKLPIVTGGTGLYLKTLAEGIAELPPIPQAVRAKARNLYDELGAAGVHTALAIRDPVSAERLGARDRQRLVRAWEVLEATGRPLADWQTAMSDNRPAHLRFAAILFDPPRKELYQTIERRLDNMILGGALDEVGALLAMKLDPHLPALKAVGVSEFMRHLEGQLTLEAALAHARQSSRRYAKRQMTWFHHQSLAKDVFVMRELLGAQFSESFEARIFNFIRHFQLTELH